MAFLPQTGLTAGRWARRGLVPLLALAAGCVTLGWTDSDTTPPRPGIPCQVVATWKKEVVFAADSMHGGRMTPGLAGRVYLFPEQVAFPMTGDGGLTVDLFDESAGPAAPAVWQERWCFDPATFQRLLRRDMIGWGYTVYLPWSKYRPDITRVRVKVTYQPAKGTPLYCESGPLNLFHEGTPTPTPGAPKPPTPPGSAAAPAPAMRLSAAKPRG